MFRNAAVIGTTQVITKQALLINHRGILEMDM